MTEAANDDVDTLPLPFEFRVAGTGYDRRYSAIRRYAQKRSELRLIPEPDNEADPFAISVHMGWANARGRMVWEMIGYVPADAAPMVNDLLGSGEWAIERAFVKALDTSPHLDAPVVWARLEGKDLRLAQPDQERPCV